VEFLVRVLVTGGAGFMGSATVRALVRAGHRCTVLDALTYAGRREHLAGVPCRLVVGSVCDTPLVTDLVAATDHVVHMAAESHVTRSIDDAQPFVSTNVEGTRVVLAACCDASRPLTHVSTDEVFGSAAPGVSFAEDDPLRPGNPYAASKAAAECLAMAWAHTFGFRARIVRCTNNFGPRQHAEKAVSGWVAAAVRDGELLLHGDGEAVRDWLHVDDFADGLVRVLAYDGPRTIFHFAGRNPLSNREMAERIVALAGAGRVVSAPERPGQDARYALDDEGTRRDIAWSPGVSVDEGLRAMIAAASRAA
jgi:dTDP-glucose 4,6-dehydratase